MLEEAGEGTCPVMSELGFTATRQLSHRPEHKSRGEGGRGEGVLGQSTLTLAKPANGSAVLVSHRKNMTAIGSSTAVTDFRLLNLANRHNEWDSRRVPPWDLQKNGVFCDF